MKAGYDSTGTDLRPLADWNWSEVIVMVVVVMAEGLTGRETMSVRTTYIEREKVFRTHIPRKVQAYIIYRSRTYRLKALPLCRDVSGRTELP